MKKSFLRFNVLLVLIVLIITVSVAYFAGCSGQAKMAESMYSSYVNLAEGKNINLKGGEGTRATETIDLGKSVEFNTVVLRESSRSVLMFNIYASNDEDATTFEHIYEGDTIEDYRVCYVGNVKYRYLRIEVASSTGKFKVNDVKVYNNKNEKASKHVTSYFILDRIVGKDAPENATPEQIIAHKKAYEHQFDALDTITDLIIFGMTDFDKAGNVIISNTELFEKNMAMLQEAVRKVEDAQGRHINILIDVFMPERFAADPNAASREMMGSSTATLNAAKSVNDLLTKYDLDGVDFDYEYPYTRTEWKLYNNFLVTFKVNLTKGKILSTAVGAWNANFSKDAVDAIDFIQLMTYDMFDSHGYHGAFSSCMIRDLNKMINKGVPVEKMTLGLPFYSRPINKGGYWGDYYRFYNDGLITNKYMNIVHSFPTHDSGNWPINDPEYFNGVQMIADKTAFAIDTNVAGVMIWHYHCDIDYANDMSLFGSIHDTLASKGASLVK